MKCSIPLNPAPPLLLVLLSSAVAPSPPSVALVVVAATTVDEETLGSGRKCGTGWDPVLGGWDDTARFQRGRGAMGLM